MAAKKLYSEDLFALADTLSLTLQRDPRKGVHSLSGRKGFSLRLWGQSMFPFVAEVVDSGIYDADGVAGIVLHTVGSLYFVMLVDAKAEGSHYLSLWAVDGGALGWAGHSPRVFPGQWDRKEFYRAFAEGVVCAYRRGRTLPWLVAEDGRQELRDYIKFTVDLKSFSLSPGAGYAVSEKYRTKGPRGV